MRSDIGITKFFASVTTFFIIRFVSLPLALMALAGLSHASPTTIVPECKNIAFETNNLPALHACYLDNGHPYAKICAKENQSFDQQICPGPRVRISNLQFSENIPFDVGVITRLSGIETGDFYHHAKILSFIKKLEIGFDIKNPKVTFEQEGPNQLVMIVDGQAPESSLGGGIFYNNEEDFMGTLDGRHYIGGSTPGFIYYAVSGPFDKLSSAEISVPMYLDQFQTGRMQLKGYHRELHVYEVKGGSGSFGMSRFKQINDALWIPKTYGARFTLEELRAVGVKSQRDEYLTFYGHWNIPSYEFLDKNVLSLESYVLDNEGLTGRLDLMGERYQKLSLPQSSYIRFGTKFSLMVGDPDRAPIRQRVYLGTPDMRGYFHNEVGSVERQEFQRWGKQFSVASQLEFLTPMPVAAEKFYGGIHLDAGFIMGGKSDDEVVSSYGLLAQYKIDDNASLRLSASYNDDARQFFQIGIQKNF